MFDPPYDISHWTHSESSSLAALLRQAEGVEHWRDHNDITGLRFTCKDKDVWIWPNGTRFSFHVEEKH